MLPRFVNRSKENECASKCNEFFNEMFRVMLLHFKV